MKSLGSNPRIIKTRRRRRREEDEERGGGGGRKGGEQQQQLKVELPFFPSEFNSDLVTGLLKDLDPRKAPWTFSKSIRKLSNGKSQNNL